MQTREIPSTVTGAGGGPSDDRFTVHSGQAASPASAITVITAHRGWFDWRLTQLWRYRDLIGLFVWRDFVSIYKQTILGPTWHILQPLLTTLTFTIVFAKMARLPTDGAPPFLFYMAGTLPWTYFANCLNNTSKTFLGYASLLGKVYFHRLVIPCALVASNLVAFGIQLTIFVAVLAGSAFFGAKIHATGWVFLSPLFVLMLAGYGFGGGIIISALTTRFRDLSYLATFGIQLMMYATPVIYPVSAVPAQYQWVPRLNPLTPVIEGFRMAFLGTGTIDLRQLTISFAVMLVLVWLGLMLFTRVERTFIDTV